MSACPESSSSICPPHGHDCSTVQEAGWAGKRNGELLGLAEHAFDLFLTLDKNLKISTKSVSAKHRRLGRANEIQPHCGHSCASSSLSGCHAWDPVRASY